ncbi:MAG: potassium channel protein [Spirulinaceae cyanobacterium]
MNQPPVFSFRQKYKRLQQEMIFGIAALAGVFLVGTLWYWLVEGWEFIEAVYMTAITLSTVGFSEVHPLENKARIFTICLIFMGLFSFGYIANRFTEALIQGYFQEGIKMRQQKLLIDSLKKHYIVCGFGRTGRQVALEFQAEGIPFIVIDSSLEKIEQAQELGCIAVYGDATLDESLQKASIDKALCLVTVLPSDAENLYTVLSAKTFNPHIRAIARASTEEAEQKLQRAGADGVVSPHITGGRRLAAAALRPQVMDFVDGILAGSDKSFYMEELRLDSETCPYIDQTLSQAKLRKKSGALVLAIRRNDGVLIVGPTGDTYLLSGDLLICMGTAEQLRTLNSILDPINSAHPRLPKHI